MYGLEDLNKDKLKVLGVDILSLQMCRDFGSPLYGCFLVKFFMSGKRYRLFHRIISISGEYSNSPESLDEITDTLVETDVGKLAFWDDLTLSDLQERGTTEDILVRQLIDSIKDFVDTHLKDDFIK